VSKRDYSPEAAARRWMQYHWPDVFKPGREAAVLVLPVERVAALIRACDRRAVRLLKTWRCFPPVGKRQSVVTRDVAWAEYERIRCAILGPKGKRS
jgi:hypothetical protein